MFKRLQPMNNTEYFEKIPTLQYVDTTVNGIHV